MRSFQKLYSITILLFAFIYPSAMAEAKDINVNNVLHQQNLELNTNFKGGDTSPEVLLAHRHNQRRYRRKRSTQHQRIRYRGQYYRRGRWQLVRDRHGRLMYDWRRH